ncbi:MAG: 2-C-methyl-D-erythritol 4-phosphate cytidylyltransferase, partial [Pseudomonadales bacterium]|nr:2-C-methyl-D-erythritol 4-phosphate cytidylyltransferase [Pseudomonadales bacterium]
EACNLEDTDLIMVHDAARPCVRESDIRDLLNVAMTEPAGAILATPVVETVKRVRHDVVAGTVDRSTLWAAQTPQVFRAGRLREALLAARREGFTVTDEASAIEHAGLRVAVVPGHRDNLKVTTPEDVELAAFYLDTVFCSSGMRA